MASISASIELYDKMSAPLMSIMGALNHTISSMYEMQQTMNQNVNTSSLDATRDAANQAQAAIEELNQIIGIQITPETTESVIPQSEPVKIPVEWETHNLEVFSSTGLERFEQEIASANQMLNTLADTQNQIAQNAAGTDVFSEGAIQDINAMAQRIQAVQQKIQQIESNPVNLGTSEANAGLEMLRSQLNQAVSLQSELNSAVENMDVGAANLAYNQLSRTVENTERFVRDNTDEQGRFNQKIQEGTNTSNKLASTIKNVAAAYLTTQTVGKIIDISDDLVSTTARINQMNDGLQSTDELMKLVYSAAQDSRGSFNDMADVVARFGNNAKDAFGSSEEVVAFANLIQKQMTIAGAAPQESANAMLQLSQALGSGVLRGDELNSIFEQAPNLIQSIADYLEVPIGKIREMAGNGELTADVVKSAIFNSADEINAKFSEMPMTWEQVFTAMKNTALMEFQPVLNKINDLANNQQFQEFAANAVGALATVANVVLTVFEVVGAVGGFIVDNWSIIGPVVYGVVAALAAYATYLGIVKAATLVKAGAEIVACLASFAHAAFTKAEASETAKATATQYGFNAALLACPLTWIVVAIIAVIAAIYMVIGWINKTKDTTISATGVIFGAVLWLGALIINYVIGLLNALIQYLWSIFVEPFIGIIEWVLTAANGGFNSFGGAVANLIGHIISWFLSLGKVVTKIIDAIFGTDWTAGLSSLQEQVTAWGTNDNAVQIELEAPEIKRIGLKNAYKAGYGLGSKVQDKVSGFFSGGLDTSDIFSGAGYDGSYGDYETGQIPSNIASTAENTGKAADSLEITSEDLKYLRDIAETEVVNRFTTAEIRVEMTNNNNISSDMDLDGVVDYLAAGVNNAMVIAAEGVHA